MDELEGRWVIDTKRKESVTWVTRINETSAILVITDDGDYYIANEENLILYDKYWFENNKEEN